MSRCIPQGFFLHYPSIGLSLCKVCWTVERCTMTPSTARCSWSFFRGDLWLGCDYSNHSSYFSWPTTSFLHKDCSCGFPFSHYISDCGESPQTFYDNCLYQRSSTGGPRPPGGPRRYCRGSAKLFPLQHFFPLTAMRSEERRVGEERTS